MLSKSQLMVRNPLKQLISSLALVALTVLMGTSDAWAKGNALNVGARPAEATQASEAAPASGESDTTPPSSASQAPASQGYAAREASAQGLSGFKGGDVLVIGGGGLVLVLLIVLIVVLI